MRVGIATGLVVVGDLIGSGEAQERGVVGDTPNLAARLQAIAEPDMVVIAESTRRLIGNLFELQDLGAKDLKGIALPARAWAALRPSPVESRFEALHASGLTALVGAKKNSSCCCGAGPGPRRAKVRWCCCPAKPASASRGSRRRCSNGSPANRIRGCAISARRSTPTAHFYPIIGQIERAAGFAHDDAPPAKLDKLDAVLAQTSTSIEDAALFAELLSLPNDGRYPPLDLTAPQRRQRTLEALIRRSRRWRAKVRC